MVAVPDVTSTVPPDVIDVEFRLSCDPDVPTLPSNTAVPVESAARNQPAVPDATAVADKGVPANVATPADAAPNAGSAHVNVTSNVPDAAVPGPAGCVPVYTLIVAAPEPASSRSTIAAHAAF